MLASTSQTRFIYNAGKTSDENRDGKRKRMMGEFLPLSTSENVEVCVCAEEIHLLCYRRLEIRRTSWISWLWEISELSRYFQYGWHTDCIRSSTFVFTGLLFLVYVCYLANPCKNEVGQLIIVPSSGSSWHFWAGCRNWDNFFEIKTRLMTKSYRIIAQNYRGKRFSQLVFHQGVNSVLCVWQQELDVTSNLEGVSMSRRLRNHN